MCSVRNFMATGKQCKYWRKLTGVGLVLFFISVCSAQTQFDDPGSLRKRFDTGLDEDSVEYLRMSPAERSAEFSRETKEIRIAQQYGLGYLPLMVVRQYGLIEKHAHAAALGSIRVVWTQFPSGKSMNSALRIGLLDLASGGIAPLLEIWDESFGNFSVKGVAALSTMPMYLNTIDPKIRTIEDFSPGDTIALPAAKVSGQAVILQMAAQMSFGDKGYNKLDGFTVSMNHPDAMQALLSGQISAHMASPPYQYEELENPRVHTILNSYDVLGGPASFSVLWTRSEFFLKNPKTFQALYNAVKEAMEIIASNPRRAAEIYTLQSNSNFPVESIHRVISDPSISFTAIPFNTMKYAKFMYTIGSIKHLPQSWRELFFPAVHAEQGS
jgi:NitT/TauT family transport system substrate-binding protein